MDLFRFNRSGGTAAILVILLLTPSCSRVYDYYARRFPAEKYTGQEYPEKHHWLRGKRIFIDPGHGGLGKKDRLRIGPNGITEEAVNLRVALILHDMLQRAGATVAMSRFRDKRVSLEQRIDMVKGFKPHLLLSIHHDGTFRRKDRVQYPTVLIWGSHRVRPASYDFARLLLHEYHRIMDSRGRVVSDFAFYKETGTKILRRTRYVCPGVIGEGGFFSDRCHAVRLKDRAYNQLEAEAWFRALSEYFRRGQPRARAFISSKLGTSPLHRNIITERNPKIYLKLSSGNSRGIDRRSLHIWLNHLQVTARRCGRGLYRINYGTSLPAGGYRVRFQFRNLRQQSSMIYNFTFMIAMQKGEWQCQISRGRRMIQFPQTRWRGLVTLLASQKMGIAHPDDDQLLFSIVQGFRLTGDRANAAYYLEKLCYFYPQSRYAGRYCRGVFHAGKWRYRIDYHGKTLKLEEFRHDCCKKID